MSEHRIAELLVRLEREARFNREQRKIINRLETKLQTLELELRWAKDNGVPDKRKNL